MSLACRQRVPKLRRQHEEVWSCANVPCTLVACLHENGMRFDGSRRSITKGQGVYICFVSNVRLLAHIVELPANLPSDHLSLLVLHGSDNNRSRSNTTERVFKRIWHGKADTIVCRLRRSTVDLASFSTVRKGGPAVVCELLHWDRPRATRSHLDRNLPREGWRIPRS